MQYSVKPPGHPFWMMAKYAGNCRRCEGAIEPGDRIYYNPSSGKAYCAGCGDTLEKRSKQSAGSSGTITGLRGL